MTASAAGGPARGSWLDRLQRHIALFDVDEPQAAAFRAQQMQAVLRLTPLAMSIQLACALVVPIALWTLVPAVALLLWSAAISLLALVSFRAWWKARRGPPRATASLRALRRIVLHALMLGTLWALLPLMSHDVTDVEAHYLVGILVSGMICAGGFAMAAVPWAGSLFVGLMGCGATVAVALRGGPLAWAFAMQLTGYTAVVIFTVWATARMMAARMVAEAKASQQSEVISLLLRDFEDHTTDLLWELDEAYRFVHMSPRFARTLGLDAAPSGSDSALDRIDPIVPDDDEARRLWQELKETLQGQDAFRDRILIVQRGDIRKWWSLSARRLRDANGQLRGWRGVASDISERQKAVQRLTWLAHNDALTGLVNRTQIRAQLQELLACEPPATPPPLALLLMDLDGFKHINDSKGHAVGDQLLKVFGERLLAISRRSDTVARLGGDEFAMLVQGRLEPQELTALLERLLAALSQPWMIDGQLFTLQASIGVVMAPADGHDVDTLMNHADIAMYAAKSAGGQRYCFFNPALAESGRRRVAMTQALRGALGRGEFSLVYQPQVSAQDWRVHGFEALIRWNSPTYGAVNPAEFIPLAEAGGMMPLLGDWVLTEACSHALQWPGAPRLSINVSAKQLEHADFADRAHAQAQRLAPGQLELEITESTLIADAESAVAVLHQLRDRGLRTALDDFGTGYSALGYLRRFPFDTLKIDRSFVKDLTRGADAAVLIDAILAMAKALGMAAVAEGVEQPIEAEMLRTKGCETLQGFLFSRPLPADQVLPFLESWDERRRSLSGTPSSAP